MEANFKLTTRLQNDILIMNTEGYVNNEGGEKILQEFDQHFARGIKRVIINLEKSKVVNSIGISFLIEVIEGFAQLHIWFKFRLYPTTILSEEEETNISLFPSLLSFHIR